MRERGSMVRSSRSDELKAPEAQRPQPDEPKITQHMFSITDPLQRALLLPGDRDGVEEGVEGVGHLTSILPLLRQKSQDKARREDAFTVWMSRCGDARP